MHGPMLESHISYHFQIYIYMFIIIILLLGNMSTRDKEAS